jgi:simple sugar transport system ATP-binding protein
VPDLSLVENFVLTDYRSYGLGPILDRQRAAYRTEMAVEEFSISAPGLDAPARQLSGGNLQKLILARELYREPSLLVAQQPTQGLDIGATEEVWKALLDAREHAAVLLVTTDMREALTLADRIAVMFRGRIMGILDAHNPDELERISTLMAGVAEG